MHKPKHATTSFHCTFSSLQTDTDTPFLSNLQGPLGWGWSGLNTPSAGMSLMAVAQLDLKQGSLQAPLWRAGWKKKQNSQWKKSRAWTGVCDCYHGCMCPVCVQIWLRCEWMCVLTLHLSKNCQLQMVKEDRGRGVTDSSSQGASISILFAGSRVWNFDEEQFASLDGYEEVGFVRCHRKAVPAHCWLQNLPTPPPTGTHPLPFTHRPPGTTFWLLWPMAIAQLCCVSKSTCWEPFHQPSLGFFNTIQGHPTTTSTHTHLKIRQIGGDTDAVNMCTHVKLLALCGDVL